MERIRGSRAGIFVLAAVMAVAFVGIFAGNATAAQSVGPVWNGGDVSILYLNGDALLGSRNPNNGTATRLDLTPLNANLQSLDESGIGDLYLDPGNADLGVTQTGSFDGTSFIRHAGLDANLSGASTWVGEELISTYLNGDVATDRSGAHIADESNAEFGFESTYYDSSLGETYGDRGGLKTAKDGFDENINLGFQETYSDGGPTSISSVGAGLDMYYNTDDNYGTAKLWANDGDYEKSLLYLDGDSVVLGTRDSDNGTQARLDLKDYGVASIGVTNSAGDKASLLLDGDSASLGVQNPDTNEWHGLYVYQDETVLTGGTSSTSLTLNDNGATFRNDATGGPARVTGVADGRNDYDAVNYRQLKTAYSGIASVAALAAIPNPPSGKRFTLGVGYGYFEGANAIAAGIKAGVNNVSFTAGVGTADDKWTASAGVGVSF